MVRAQISSAVAPTSNSRASEFEEPAEHGERARVGAPVVEHAEQAGQQESTPTSLLQETGDRRLIVVRHDLCQEEIGGGVRGQEIRDLCRRVACRVGPAAQQQIRLSRPDLGAQLPAVLDTPRRADVAVAAQHHQRLEAQRVRPIRVAQTVRQRVLGGQKRYHHVSRRLCAQVGAQMAQVVLLLLTDGAVGQEDKGLVAGQPPDRVVGIDPRVDAGRGIERGAWRAQLRRDDGPVACERLAK